MNANSFVDRLYSLSGSYHWNLEHGKVTATLRSGPNKGETLNPVTALAYKAGYGIFENTRDGTESAASVLGIPRSTAREIYSATLGTNNRGNTQVVRGRIRSALEV
tara:strand:- start:584 stop:901 length:318 start_codon:yes stop_codon:yes gene_type:complete